MPIYVPSREAYERSKEEWMERSLHAHLGVHPRELGLNLSRKCFEVLGISRLDEEPDVKERKYCIDFREQRRWVMCRAWQLYELGKVDRFGEAIRRAWFDLKVKCATKY